MIRRSALVALWLAIALTLWTASTPAHAARSKPGPVTIRGVVAHLSGRTFDLATLHQGSYTVHTSAATTVTEKGVSGRVTLVDGTHVGVRGLVSGRVITAITVRVYPVKPKAVSLNGVVQRVHGNQLTVIAGGKPVVVTVDRNTQVVGTPASGRRVHLRVIPGPHGPVAQLVHVYVTHALARHVTLHGTVLTATPTGLTVQVAGVRSAVKLAPSTTLYLGSTVASRSALRAGETVTVHACCVGSALTATSIHIVKTRARTASALVQGVVLSVTSGSLRLSQARGAQTVRTTAATVYEVGSSPTGRTGIWVGDRVSIRVRGSGAAASAVRVRVYAASRRPRTVRGTIVAISASRITVQAGNTRTTAALTRSTAVLAGKSRVTPSALHSGSTARVRLVPERGGLVAQQIVLAALKAKPSRVSGTIASVSGQSLVVLDATGSKHLVEVGRATTISVHGSGSAPQPLLPGLKVSVRGTLRGSTLVATTLSVTVHYVVISGRVLSVGSGGIDLRLSLNRSTHVVLPLGLVIHDGTGHAAPQNIGVGAQLRAKGYVLANGTLRPTALRVLHPTLALRGTVSWQGATAQLLIGTGDRYLLRVAKSLAVATGHLGLTVSLKDVPPGVTVSISGQINTDGSLSVRTAGATLHTEHLEDRITALRATTLSVGSATVQLTASTQILQGTRPLTAADLVVGDLVTVEGYAITSGVIARRLLVHRKLAGFDGTVTVMSSDGFTFNAADGAHVVLVSSTTVLVNDSTLVMGVGSAVHVTGYLRGDGSILATRVTVLKKARLRYGGRHSVALRW